MPPKLDIQQVKQILAASDLIASWQVLIEDETAQRALYKIRCRVIRYQLFTDRPIIRSDNAPHFPALHGYPHHVHGESSEVDESTLTGDPILDLPYVLSRVRDLVTKPSR